ncbi:MAG: Rpp14/Pop5 family protein [Candidatus Aenigmatarchaeota archaeon]
MLLDDKPQHLPPTLRPNHRYMAYQVLSEKKVSFDDLVAAMWHSLMNFTGELGASQSRVWILRNMWDHEKQLGLLRCEHGSVEEVRAGLALVQRVGEMPIVIKVLGISGTAKAARQKFFGERSLQSFA